MLCKLILGVFMFCRLMGNLDWWAKRMINVLIVTMAFLLLFLIISVRCETSFLDISLLFSNGFFHCRLIMAGCYSRDACTSEWILSIRSSNFIFHFVKYSAKLFNWFCKSLINLWMQKDAPKIAISSAKKPRIGFIMENIINID